MMEWGFREVLEKQPSSSQTSLTQGGIMECSKIAAMRAARTLYSSARTAASRLVNGCGQPRLNASP